MNERLNAIVGARIAEFKKKMADVQKTIRSLPNKTKVKINIVTKEAEKRIKNFQNKMDRLSNTIHAFDSVGRNMLGGGLMLISPAAIPILASAVGLLGTLGPMIGVVAGSAFALATAFGFAGTAAFAFGAAAVPTISKLFGETEKLTDAQKAAKGEYTKFQDTWKGIVKDLEQPVLDAFGKSMQFANKVIQMARPLFDSAATAVNNLLDSLNASMDSPPIKAFFDYMNTSAGPMLETLGKAFGNFTQGFMSMMTAFGPLAEQTAQGFLDMSQNFATWAAGLGENEKFKSFVKYVSDNMPKIKSIVGDAIAGVVNTFAAFGPLASDMMTGLQDMMGKFREWSSTLGENPQFQKFIGYIRDNAPQVFSLIGNIVMTLINFGVAMAPIGQQVLEIANKFFSWTSSMLEAHPWLGKIVGGAVLLMGAFQLAIPFILAMTSLFPGLGAKIMGVIPKIGGMILNVAKLGTSLLLNGARMAAGWILGMGPIGWIIAIVIALVILVIANWEKVKEWTIKVWTAVSDWVKNAWDTISTATKAAATLVSNWVKDKFNEIKQNVQSKMDEIKNKIQTAWDYIKNRFALTILSIVQTVRDKFNEIKNAVQEKMNDVKTKVQDGIDKVKSYLSGIDLSSMGKQMIQGLINGIKNMAGNLVSAATGVVDGAVNAAKSLLGIASPSKLFYSFGEFVDMGLINGINSMTRQVSSAASNLAGVVADSFSPKVGFEGINSKTVNTFEHESNGQGKQVNVTVNGSNVNIDEKRLVSLLQRTEALYG